MPKITQTNQIDITPERFLEACSDLELVELDILIQSPRFKNKISFVNQSEDLVKIAASLLETQYFKQEQPEVVVEAVVDLRFAIEQALIKVGFIGVDSRPIIYTDTCQQALNILAEMLSKWFAARLEIEIKKRNETI